MVHRRSSEKLKQRKENYEELVKKNDLARAIVKDYSQKDLETGEISFTAETPDSAYKVLKEIFGDGDNTTVHALNHDLGEVLNRAIVPCWWR